MANESVTCSCCAAPKLIFPCSGAADVGEITDRAARRITKSSGGCNKMFCLAGIGGGVEDIVGQTRLASAIIAIDGCSADCAKKTLELAGLTNFKHIRLSDMGMEKGKAPATYENITAVVKTAEALLSQ